ncbi:hypothetical protein ACAW74_04930 [Fibrella sp. WM1]|uniref:hypothetical protein n=1 Tax=Fibrella musci TaxID=3242485 RepID=UPI0035227ABD
MTPITDLLSLTAFIEEAVQLVPTIEKFMPLSNGLKAINEIEAYYTNDYAGITCFLQVAESQPKTNGAGLDSLTFLCSLTVAMKPADPGAGAGLLARNETQKLLLHLLGRLRAMADRDAEELEDLGEPFELMIQPGQKMFPIGLLANVELEGYYIDVDVTVPANRLLFPDAWIV